MMYPIDKCYFCECELDAGNPYLLRCINATCCAKYRYRYFIEDLTVEFVLGDYLFEMQYVIEDDSKNEMIIWKRKDDNVYNYLIDSPMMLVTEDNYLDIINRFEKLNVFK